MSVYNKNLANQYVSESFQRLLQVSGSNNVVLNGNGTPVELITVFSSLWEFVSGSTSEVQPVDITGSNIMISTDPYFDFDENKNIQPRQLLFEINSNGEITTQV